MLRPLFRYGGFCAHASSNNFSGSMSRPEAHSKYVEARESTMPWCLVEFFACCSWRVVYLAQEPLQCTLMQTKPELHTLSLKFRSPVAPKSQGNRLERRMDTHRLTPTTARSFSICSSLEMQKMKHVRFGIFPAENEIT